MLNLFAKLVGASKELEAIALLEECVVRCINIHGQQPAEVEFGFHFNITQAESAAEFAVVGRVLADPLDGVWREEKCWNFLIINVEYTIRTWNIAFGRAYDFERSFSSASYAYVGAFEKA